MKRILRSTFGVCAAIVLSGCGGSGGSCGVADTCGGDVVGTWTIANTCLSTTTVSDVLPDCPASSISILGLQISGTIEYRADLTYSTQATVSVTERMILPLECLGTTCTEFNASAQANPNFSSASCVASATACVCVISIGPMPGVDTGTYTTSGGVLSLVPTTGTPEQDNYCIKGNTMIVASTMGMMGGVGMQAAGTLTLVRQP